LINSSLIYFPLQLVTMGGNERSQTSETLALPPEACALLNATERSSDQSSFVMCIAVVCISSCAGGASRLSGFAFNFDEIFGINE